MTLYANCYTAKGVEGGWESLLAGAERQAYPVIHHAGHGEDAFPGLLWSSSPRVVHKSSTVVSIAVESLTECILG